MSNSQHFNPTSDPTFAKLQEVDSGLASQETQLLAQLASLREKRQSLQTVISLFVTTDNPPISMAEEATPVPLPKADREPETVKKAPVALAVETAGTTTAVEPETETTPQTQPKAARTNASSSSKTTNGQRTTRTTLQRASGWQQYVRDEFQKTSLPEAVNSVLHRQEKQVFEIPAVVDAIFETHLPKEVRDKARHQITNILAEGARKNRWYRGRLGTYSLSRAAAKASSKS